MVSEEYVKIQKADPGARRIFIIIMVLVVGAGLSMSLAVGKPEHWLTGDSEELRERIELLIVALYLVNIPVAVVGVYVWRQGAAARVAGRFPPPDMKVIADTPIREGRRAQFLGRMMQASGVFICLAAIGVPTIILYILHAVAGDG